MKTLLGLVLFIQVAFALDMSERRQAIINIIDEEVSEVQRLSGQVNHQNPSLFLREAELYLEKARLIREVENEYYLSLPVEKRRRSQKKSFFNSSKNLFERAQFICEKLLKKFKRFKQKGDVYYIMAYNAKELGQVKKSKKYFKLSLKNSSRNSKTTVKSQVALADIYYNEKKYSSAVPLYKNSLEKNDDKWWTKDAFNLAWSYFRVKKYNLAISYMREVHSKSKSEQYIDMSEAVERDIGLFYAQAGRTKEGLNFYEQLGKNFTEVLINISLRLKADSRYAQAKMVLIEALKVENNDSQKIKIYSELMELYAQYSRRAELLKVCTVLSHFYKQGSLNSEQIERLKFHTQNQAAVLQKQVASKTYKRLKKQREAKANRAIAFFDIVYELIPSKRAETRFLQGETYFAIGDFHKSLSYYEMAHVEASKQSDVKFKKLSTEAMLATLGQRKLDQKVKERYYTNAYNKYLELDSSSNKASSIFKKLFNVHFEQKNYSQSEATLYRYKENFPNDYKTQESMIARLMDQYRKENNFEKVSSWINKVEGNEFKTSANYKIKVKELLTNMQMKSVQVALAKGEKVRALKGYHEVFDQPNSTEEAKKNSAYNIAVLYYELGNEAKTYDWALKSLSLMKPRDVKRFEDSFLTFSSFFFDKREFDISADLSLRTLGKLCRQRTKSKKIFFKNSVFVYLAQNNLAKAKSVIGIGEKCRLPQLSISEAKIEVLKEIGKKEEWVEYEKTLVELKSMVINQSDLIPFFNKLYKVYQKLGEQSKALGLKEQALNIYKADKSKKRNIKLESLDIIASYLFEDVYKTNSVLTNMKLSFPEKMYNQRLKNKLAMLDRLTNSALKVHETGSGKGIVESYKIIIEAYRGVANEIEAFVPPGKPESYVKSFKADMRGIIAPLRQQAEKYRVEALKQINQYDILSKDTFYLLDQNENYIFDYSYYLKASSMDRGGRR